jgi:hypothetical protein
MAPKKPKPVHKPKPAPKPYHHHPPHPTHPPHPVHPSEDLRLEAVTVSVGFDDLLDVTLQMNHPHLDTMIVVTAHEDRKTQAVCAKHGAFCVPTDLVQKNGRTFNKGAAINAGFGYFQYYGYRLHLDADIVLPDNCRRVLFNHTNLDPQTIYGADRVNIIGRKEIDRLRLTGATQHQYKCLMESLVERPIGGRFVSTLHGYLPLGYFQLWHAKCQKTYPYSLGTAAHDDTLYAALWPLHKRALLSTLVVYHLCERTPIWGENWDGRRQPRLS